MKIAIIHSAANGFFPRFYLSLRKSIIRNEGCCKLFIPNIKTNRQSDLPDKYVWGTRANTVIHNLLYRITGLQDIFSFVDTLFLLVKLSQYKPDIIHCHIINNKCLNILLFKIYINRTKTPLIWTMHDCRAITGRCAFFDEIGCSRWKTGCGKCPQKQLYEPTWIDNSHLEWRIKNKVLSSIHHLTIVTPSQWLANVMKCSYLNDKALEIINNGINLEFLNSCQKQKLDLIKLYNLTGKYKVLGVASAWEERKGLNVFSRLAEDLPSSYSIILVGNLPYKIKHAISIPRTNSISDLNIWYQIADVFVNPTLADNFPTTNIEALAAGTPVVTYNTGGSGEIIDATCGIVVDRGDYEAIKKAILEVTQNRHKFTKNACLRRSKDFSIEQFERYCELYQHIIMS